MVDYNETQDVLVNKRGGNSQKIMVKTQKIYYVHVHNAYKKVYHTHSN